MEVFVCVSILFFELVDGAFGMTVDGFFVRRAGMREINREHKFRTGPERTVRVLVLP